MEEIIKINNNEGKLTVSARELYLKLGYNIAVWARWYKKNIIKNQFAIEGEDWIPFNLKLSADNQLNPNPTIDFLLSIEFAKKICMMAKTDMGELIRCYFLECEKKVIEQKPLLTAPLTPVEMYQLSANIMAEQERQLKEVSLRQSQIESAQVQIKQTTESISLSVEKLQKDIQKKADAPEPSMEGYFTVYEYLIRNRKKSYAGVCKDIGGMAYNICMARNIHYYSKPSTSVYGKVNCYPEPVLAEAFELTIQKKPHA